MENSKGRSKSWLKQDDEFLIQNYATHTAKQIATMLGFPENTIYIHVKKLKLNKSKQCLGKVWSKDEEIFLIENYKTHSRAELASHFDISVETISRKIRELGLRKINPRIWTDELDKILRVLGSKHD
ncbi:MAG: hypothetical protein FWD67_07310 [Betaproteobacteria bacterium]|nr:hypothetical protein [Betaproteobacteria bacterium]